MKELAAFIVKNRVDNPGSIRVNEEADGNHIELSITVDPADRGKIIGKEGRVVTAIRTVITAAASKKNTRASVEICD